MRILICEPDRSTAQNICLTLRAAGLKPYDTDDGEDAVELARIYEYDAIVLNKASAGILTGYETLSRIRRAGLKTPVIMGGVDATAADVVTALNGGADDWIRYPAASEEFIARLRAVVRRSRGHVANTITTGPITLDLDQKQVRVNGAALHLTGKEYQMMELLALRKGQTLSKDAFLTHLYGGMDEPELKIIDVFICKLRKKVRDACGADYIETVWGRGYKMTDTPRERGAQGAGRTGVVRQDPLSTSKGQILQVLAEVGKDVKAGTVAARLGLEPASVYSRLSYLRDDGHVRSHGIPRERTYEITPAGRDWLMARGWKPAEVAAAA